MQMLVFPWYLLAIFLIVPWFVRDFCYKCFASVRYRLFGQVESCRMPTADIKRRFLDYGDVECTTQPAPQTSTTVNRKATVKEN